MLAALIRLFPNHNLWIWRWACALNFFGRPWRGLFWVEPVLLNRCMVLATVLQLSFKSNILLYIIAFTWRWGQLSQGNSLTRQWFFHWQAPYSVIKQTLPLWCVLWVSLCKWDYFHQTHARRHMCLISGSCIHHLILGSQVISTDLCWTRVKALQSFLCLIPFRLHIKPFLS